MEKKYEFNYSNKRNNIIFEYPEKKNSKLNNLDKWTQLDSIFRKNKRKNKTINFPEDININENLILSNKTNNFKDINSNKSINLSLQNLIHHINYDEFDKFIDNKIDILEKLKDNKYHLNDNLDLDNPNKINKNINTDNNINRNSFNIILSKYKKEENSIIRAKNEPILISTNNNTINSENDDKYEFNKMKTKNYFFNNNNVNRLNNLLRKIRNTNQKNEKNKEEIYQIDIKPSQYFENIINKQKNKNINYEDSDDDNKDYFSQILDEINFKKKK